MSSPSAPTGATDHEPSVQDLVVPVQVDQAGIQEPAAVTHNVDPEDDQRGDEDVFDESHYSGAATGNSLTRELVQTHKTVFTYNGEQFSVDLQSSDSKYSLFPASSRLLRRP
jgi:hypothetical protein